MARKMKDSGIKWIGQIPEDWNMIRLCNMTDDIFLGRTPIYSESSNCNYIIGQKNNQSYGIDFDGVKYGTDEFFHSRTKKEHLSFGDILLNTLGGGSVGRLGYWDVSDDNEYITDGHIMILRTNKDNNSKFIFYALSAQQKVLEDESVGSTNQAFLTVNQIYKRKIALPAIKEQQRIADYLDAKVAKIDEAIIKTRITIEEYKALKQSIITKAVTKGVRGDRPMKDSGIEWIGEIPEEWKECRFYSILSVVESLVDPTLPEYKNLLHVGPGNIEKMTGKLLECITAEAEGLTSGKYVFDENCIVYGKINPQLGKVCIPGFKGLCSADAYAFRVISNDNIRYIYYQLLSLNFYNYSVPRSFRMGMPKINREELSQYKFLIPSNSEQMEIVDYLDRKCASIDNIISKKEQLISELESYKKSLIYEYVTGKKEVPGYGN